MRRARHAVGEHGYEAAGLWRRDGDVQHDRADVRRRHAAVPEKLKV